MIRCESCGRVLSTIDAMLGAVCGRCVQDSYDARVGRLERSLEVQIDALIEALDVRPDEGPDEEER